MMRLTLLCCTALVFLPGTSSAQVRDTARTDSVRILSPIIATTAREFTAVGGASAVVLRVDSLHLPAAPTLSELMREVPLLHVRTNSRGEAEIVARGSESRSVAVLLDGIPITLGWDARADASVLSAAAATQIMFTRGLSSMLHGPNVLGGVLETSSISEHEQPPRSVEMTGSYESKGGYGTSASATIPVAFDNGALVLRAGGSLRDIRGFPLPDGVNEPVPTTDGLRVNTDHRSISGFAAARYRFTSGPWLSLATSATRSERGIAAELGVEDGDARFWRYPNVARTVAVLSGGTGFHGTPLGRGDLEVSLGYDEGRTEIVAYEDRTYETQSSFENGDDRTLTLRVLGDHTIGARGDLRAAFTLSEIRHDEFLPAGENRYRQQLMSIGGETVWRVAERAGPLSALRFTVGGAFDAGRTPEAGDKPLPPDVDDWGARAGLSAYAGEAVQLHMSASRRGRFPALREAFSGALDRFEPNPDLTPEHLTAIEAGATTTFANGQVQLVGFHHSLTDAIVRITLPDRRFMRVNENELRTTGVEVLGAYRLGRVDLSGDVSVQSAEFITPELRQGHMESQPEVSGNLRGRMPIVLGADLSANVEYTGRQYCLAATGEDVALHSGARLGGDISRVWAVRTGNGIFSRAEARVAVDNAGDIAMYDQCGLPRPGRLLRFQLRLF
ncbi:MAG TPA: TonB-dependent receptor [Longimicrobiales bacterium]